MTTSRRTRTKATREKPRSRQSNGPAAILAAAILVKAGMPVEAVKLAMTATMRADASAAAAVAARAADVTVKVLSKVPAKVKPKAKIAQWVKNALATTLKRVPKAQFSLLAKATKKAPPQTTTVPVAAAAAVAEAATATVTATVMKPAKLLKAKLLKAKLPKTKLVAKFLLAIPKLLLKLQRKLRLLK